MKSDFQEIHSLLGNFKKSVILNILCKKLGNKCLSDNHIPEFLILFLADPEIFKFMMLVRFDCRCHFPGKNICNMISFKFLLYSQHCFKNIYNMFASFELCFWVKAVIAGFAIFLLIFFSEIMKQQSSACIPMIQHMKQFQAAAVFRFPVLQ